MALKQNLLPVPPPQPLSEPPEYPPLTINPLPAPHASTENLRRYVDCLIREEQIMEEKLTQRRLTDLYAEREVLERNLVAYSTLTVTNYSEYVVLFKALDIPNDAKVWVHEETSPRSVACIPRRREEEKCRRKILFASYLSAEQLAGDLNHLFNAQNPHYSSDSSEVLEFDDNGYSSDPDLAAVAADAAKLA
ncbi:Mitochondrial fission 1 protein [Bienertia sinuspersici]